MKSSTYSLLDLFSCPLIVTLVFVLDLTTIYAQDAGLGIESFNVNDGICDTRVNSIVQGPSGMIWIATRNGLSRFDGHSFKNYRHNPNDSTSIPHNKLETLMWDSQGNLWISFAEGGDTGISLCKFSPVTEIFTPVDIRPKEREIDPNLIISSMLETHDGYLWFGFWGKETTLARLDPKSKELRYFFHEPNDPNSLSEGAIFALYEDRKQTLWVGNGASWIPEKRGGLHQYHPDKENFTRYTEDLNNPQALQDFSVMSMFEDSKGNFWVGTGSTGLYQMDRSAGTFQHYPVNLNIADSLSGLPPIIESIHEDIYGRLWFGAMEYNTSLVIWDPVTKQKWQYKSDILKAAKLLEDNFGNIWTGAGTTAGLYKISPFPLIHEVLLDLNKPSQDIQGNMLLAFTNSFDNQFWIATEKGIHLFDPQTRKNKAFFPLVDPPQSPELYHFLNQVDLNSLWYRTPNKLFKIDLQNPESSLKQPLIEFDTAASFVFLNFQDELIQYQPIGENQWNITKLDKKKGTLPKIGGTIFSKDGLAYLWEDRNEKVWVAGPKKLTILSSNLSDTLKVFPLSASRFWESSDGTIWIGTDWNGLWSYNPDNDSLTQYENEQGLMGSSIFGLWGDEQDNLWIITNAGFSYYNAETLNIVNFPIEQYPAYSLIIPNPIAIREDQNGSPYYIVQNRLIRLNTRVKDLPIIPPKITLCEIRSKKTSEPLLYQNTSSLSFPYDQNDLSIEYVGIHSTDPTNNTYAYWLEGSDKDWVDARTAREARFNNLDPGNYTFRVKCKSSQGSWSEEASIFIEILPPWWQTWWAYSLYVFTGVGLIFSFIRWRTTSLRRKQELLRKRVFEQTQEIRAEQQRAEDLLLNILPPSVARELKENGKTQLVFFEEVSILFTDFKGFTNIVASIPGRKLVQELDEIFQAYDDIIEEVGLEKIQTVGDAYLAACGVPDPDPDHANKCVTAAKKITEYLEKRNQTESIKWQVRVGIHTGPITAGVIGKKKFSYDLFGDTINIAARMESASEAGKINVSAYTYDLIKDTFPSTYRGKIDAKGKGELDMYFVN
ncbi:MAG: adenylate/guanylate cyclase domain-containing protein [Bacteroidota bacterium]